MARGSISNLNMLEFIFERDHAAGGGLEYAFAPHWTAKAEYLYYDLGTISCNSSMTATLGVVTFATVGVTSTADFKGNIVRAGINYKFW